MECGNEEDLETLYKEVLKQRSKRSTTLGDGWKKQTRTEKNGKPSLMAYASDWGKESEEGREF